MVYSYISVVLWREVWSFLTCQMPTLQSIFPSAAHFHLMTFVINIHLFHPYDTHSSPLTYSYPLRPISLVASLWSPVPTPPKSSLPHPSDLLFAILTLFSLSHPFSTLLQSSSVLGWAEQTWTTLSLLWSLANDREQAKNPLKKVKGGSGDDTSIKRYVLAFTQTGMDICACAPTLSALLTRRSTYACGHMHKVRHTQTEARALKTYCNI